MDEYEIVTTPKNLRHILKSSESMVWQIRWARRELREPHNYRVRDLQHKPKVVSGDFLNALDKVKSRVARKLTLAFTYKGFRQPLEDNYFHLENDGNISFFPKPINSGDDSWPDGKRIIMRPGRFIRRFLRPWYAKDISDNELNEFASKMKAYVMENQVQVKILPVNEAYSFKHTHFKSCMQNKPVDEFYNYIGVNDCICVIDSNNTLLGRALIWDDASMIPGCKGFIDRIYGSIAAELLIKQWAHKNGYAYKQRQSCDCSILVLPTWECVAIDFVWKAELPCVCYYPYMDTLYCYNNREMVFGTPQSISTWDIMLRNTDGK